MSHKDSPTGKQYHVRHWSPKNQAWLWGLVFDDLEVAQASFQATQDTGFDAKIFIRDVSPWREVTS